MDKPQEFWNRVLWSAETQIKVFGSGGVRREWRKPNTADDKCNTLPTAMHGGGSILIWGCMSANGTGNFHCIDGNLDQLGYNNILKANVKQSAAKLGLGRNFIFQQDNDPKHTAQINREWLIWNIAKQLGTPPQSADLNPIEHLWSILKPRVHKRKPSSIPELKRIVTEEWCKISRSTCQKLVNSMQRRCQAVIKAKGWSTKY